MRSAHAVGTNMSVHHEHSSTPPMISDNRTGFMKLTCIFNKFGHTFGLCLSMVLECNP